MTNKSYTLAQIAELIGARIEGDAKASVTGIASITDAQNGQLTYLAMGKYRKHLRECKALAVITSEKYAKDCPR